VTPRAELVGSLVITGTMLVALMLGNRTTSPPPPSPDAAVCEIAPGGGSTNPPFQSK
jgi:hypothetical protein